MISLKSSPYTEFRELIPFHGFWLPGNEFRAHHFKSKTNTTMSSLNVKEKVRNVQLCYATLGLKELLISNLCHRNNVLLHNNGKKGKQWISKTRVVKRHSFFALFFSSEEKLAGLERTDSVYSQRRYHIFWSQIVLRYFFAHVSKWSKHYFQETCWKVKT